jgi:Ca2+-binding RTX toxin-like protein
MMLGLLGLVGALLATMSLDTGADRPDGEDEGEDTETGREAAWAVSTDFLDPEYDDPAEHGGTEPDGQPVSDDLDDPADPDKTLVGGTGDDRMQAGTGNDDITAGQGDDFLSGDAGEDALWADEGDDYGQGGDGADRLSGGDGNDNLWGDGGNDWLTGGADDDLLAGCEGDDRIAAGDGQDSAMGGGGDDTLLGGAGLDTLLGGEGADSLTGGDGADALEGGEGDDVLWGADENGQDQATDFLNGGGGADTLHLGAGDYGHGGSGADSFALQDFAPGSALVQITDFDPAEDQLVVIYDAALHPAASLSLQAAGGSTILLLDGVPLASLTNGAEVELGAIRLQAA